jgi:hypothetical protein
MKKSIFKLLNEKWPQKSISLLIVLLFPGFHLFGQKIAKEYHAWNFPTDSYSVDSIRYALEEFKILIIKIKEIPSENSKESTKIWLQQFIKGEKIAEHYLGEAEYEYGFYVPRQQNIPHFFIFVECWEYRGMIHLIGTNGQRHQLPGYYFAYIPEKNLLLTRGTGEGNETEVASMDLNTLKIEIRQNEKSAYFGEKNLSFYKVKEGDWLR